MATNEEKFIEMVDAVSNLTQIHPDLACDFAAQVLYKDVEFREYVLTKVKANVTLVGLLIVTAETIEKIEASKRPANVIPFRKAN